VGWLGGDLSDFLVGAKLDNTELEILLSRTFSQNPRLRLLKDAFERFDSKYSREKTDDARLWAERKRGGSSKGVQNRRELDLPRDGAISVEISLVTPGAIFAKARSSCPATRGAGRVAINAKHYVPVRRRR
jgi:hypothetical protein